MDNSLINTNFVKHLMQKNNIDEKILAQKNRLHASNNKETFKWAEFTHIDRNGNENC